LVEQALSEERKISFGKIVLNRAPNKLWTDYTVTSAVSGNLSAGAPGWERGESFCSCPDFRKAL
jgi:hypothetical protein